MTTNSGSAANDTGAVGSAGGINGGTSAGGNGPLAGGPGAAPVKAAKGFRLQLQQLLAGVEALIPAGSAVASVNGTSLTQADMVQTLTKAMAAYATADGLVTELSQARLQIEAGLPAAKAYYDELKSALTTYFGKTNPQLAQLGFKPFSGRRPLTSTQKVVAAAKAKQTRALRHTGGARQKAQLQFAGQVAVSTQVSAPNFRPAAGPPSAIAPPGAGAPTSPQA